MEGWEQPCVGMGASQPPSQSIGHPTHHHNRQTLNPKNLLNPQGQVVSSVDEAEHAYVNVLNKGDAVVKAQVSI